MSKNLNINFTIHAPKPIDSRMQVSTYTELSNIAVKYVGLKTYVTDEDAEYRYLDSGWVKIDTTQSSGEGIWGSITGVLSDQTDLQNALDLKFDKVGGVISGATIVQDVLSAYNLIIYGSTPSIQFPYLLVVDVPSTASSSGIKGQIAYESGYFYICTDTNTWERTSLATW